MTTATEYSRMCLTDTTLSRHLKSGLRGFASNIDRVRRKLTHDTLAADGENVVTFVLVIGGLRLRRETTEKDFRILGRISRMQYKRNGDLKLWLAIHYFNAKLLPASGGDV